MFVGKSSWFVLLFLSRFLIDFVCFLCFFALICFCLAFLFFALCFLVCLPCLLFSMEISKIVFFKQQLFCFLRVPNQPRQKEK